MSDDLSNPYNKLTPDPANPYRKQSAPDLVFAPEEPNKSRGCFFYGCITALVLALLGLILTGVLVYFAYSWSDKTIKEYSSTTPVVLPEVKLPEEESKALEERWKTFKDAVDKGEAAELTLNADEINALIQKQPDLKGKFFVSIKDDKISGQMSLPLDWIPLGLGKGRFFNGSATLTVSLHDGNLVVHAKSIEAHGKTPPPDFMAQFARQNLAKDVMNNPQHAEMINRFDSIEVKDGKVHLKAHSKSATESAETKEKAKDDADSPKAKDDGLPKADPDSPKAKEDEPRTSKPKSPEPSENKGDDDAPAEKKAA